MEVFNKITRNINKYLLILLITINFIQLITCFNRRHNKFKNQTNAIIQFTTQQSTKQAPNKLKYNDIYYEINESIVLNCSLRVNKDQHVVWHRKYDNMGVHVLTIGSETFISDLRIRPIKQQFFTDLNESNQRDDTNFKLTWNLEIRRLKKDDSAKYYCVLNSENSYGQIYHLNVLSHFKSLNKSEIIINSSEISNLEKPIYLLCKYDDLILNGNDQIKWFFNRYRIKNTPITNASLLLSDSDFTNQFTVIQTLLYDKNSTLSTLVIHNFNTKLNYGRYKCQYKGLTRTVKLYDELKTNSNRIIYKQSTFLVSSSVTIQETNKIRAIRVLSYHLIVLFINFILFYVL